MRCAGNCHRLEEGPRVCDQMLLVLLGSGDNENTQGKALTGSGISREVTAKCFLSSWGAAAARTHTRTRGGTERQWRLKGEALPGIGTPRQNHGQVLTNTCSRTISPVPGLRRADANSRVGSGCFLCISRRVTWAQQGPGCESARGWKMLL